MLYQLSYIPEYLILAHRISPAAANQTRTTILHCGGVFARQQQVKYACAGCKRAVRDTITCSNHFLCTLFLQSLSKLHSEEFPLRVLIADAFETSGRDALTGLGCEVLYEPKLTDAQLPDATREKQVDVLVVRSTKVSATVFESPSLKLVVRAGAGYNTIDVAAASKRGVYVSNCPGKNSVAVAELAFGLILCSTDELPTT